MELPIDEKDNEKMVGVPELFKVGFAHRGAGKPDHDTEGNRHDPSGNSGSSEEIGSHERNKALPWGLLHCDGKLGKIDHMREDVHGRADDDGPGGGLVEGDVLVEWDDIVERGATQHRDKVAANGEEDKDDIDMEDQRRRSSSGYKSSVPVLFKAEAA